MSLKMITVRVPESTRKYLKQKAAAEDTTLQEVVNTIFTDYQSKDTQYKEQLDQSVTDSLNALAQFAEQGVTHGV